MALVFPILTEDYQPITERHNGLQALKLRASKYLVPYNSNTKEYRDSTALFGQIFDMIVGHFNIKPLDTDIVTMSFNLNPTSNQWYTIYVFHNVKDIKQVNTSRYNDLSWYCCKSYTEKSTRGCYVRCSSYTEYSVYIKTKLVRNGSYKGLPKYDIQIEPTFEISYKKTERDIQEHEIGYNKTSTSVSSSGFLFFSSIYGIKLSDYEPEPSKGVSNKYEPMTLQFSSLGMTTLWQLTEAELNTIGNFLFSNTISEALLTSMTKYFTSVTDAIISLGAIFCTAPPYIRQNMKIGILDVGLEANKITNPITVLDCGTVHINKKFNSFMDYNPNTSIQCYLPYIGFIDLDSDIVMDKDVNIKYIIDFSNGNFNCIINVSDGDTYNNDVYTFLGNCLITLPITSNDYGSMTLTTATTLATAGLNLAFGSQSSAVGMSGATSLSSLSKTPVSSYNYHESAGISKNWNSSNAVSELVGSVNKPATIKSSGYGGSSGYLGTQKPYIIINRPNPYYGAEYPYLVGQPINETTELVNLSGYTKVREIHLENIICTDEEISEIEMLLKQGVIL